MDTLNRKTFKVISSINGFATVYVVTPNYDDFKQWMPFVQFNQIFLESMPMKTSFSCPVEKIEDMKETMKKYGYVEEV